MLASQGSWAKENSPIIQEQVVKSYLVDTQRITELEYVFAQCGHLYDLKVCQDESIFYLQAKCRPTMRKNPPFYFILFFRKCQSRLISGFIVSV